MVTIRPKYACSKGRAGVAQARAPAHLLEGSWPTEAMLAHIAVAKHSEHMPLNRQVRVMARHGFPVERSVLADWMGRVCSACRAGRRPDGRLAEIRNFPALRPLLSYEQGGSCARLGLLPGASFMPGSGGGRTVPLLVSVDRCRV